MRLLIVSFQVSGLFMAEENTLYVNINLVINGVLDTKDKRLFICLCSKFAYIQPQFAAYFRIHCWLTRNTGKIIFGMLCV